MRLRFSSTNRRELALLVFCLSPSFFTPSLSFYRHQFAPYLSICLYCSLISAFKLSFPSLYRRLSSLDASLGAEPTFDMDPEKPISIYTDLVERYKALTLRLEAAEAEAKVQKLLAQVQKLLAQEQKLLAQAADAEVKEQKRLTQNTTLTELLTECHWQIDKLFTVETNPKLCTKGTVTSPAGKKCPRYLRPWLDFPQAQVEAFQAVFDHFHPPGGEAKREFTSIEGIKGIAGNWHRGSISSEADLKTWQNTMVEDFVAKIWSSMNTVGTFSNHAHILGGSPDALSDRHNEAKLPVNADQLYVIFRDKVGELLLILEYKAPHKLTVEHLRASVLHAPTIDLREIINETSWSTETAEHFFSLARYLLAATATQTYDYMIGCGCQYACIVTGAAIVFLRVQEDDPTSLYYHMAEPVLDAMSNEDLGFQSSKSTIAQLLSFCVMAFPPTRQARDQAWIRQAKESASVWIRNDIEFYQTPQKLRQMEPKMDIKDLSYRPSSGPVVDRSPVRTRKSNKLRGCAEPITASGQDDEDPDADSNEDPRIPTPSKPATTRRPQGQRQDAPKQGSGSVEGKGKGKERQGQYCTQACLLGLVRRLPIDDSCPNAASHPRRKKANGTTHALTKTKLCDLLRRQLADTMDEDCENLRLQGARGMLFRLSLASHGYTFVGKGTISLFTPDLRHEGYMYYRLRKLQGRLIPVCLGNIDLDIPWYGFCTEIVHMLLMSFGGATLGDSLSDDQELQVLEFEKAIAALGIRHRDIRSPNMLWSEESQRLIFIDFERSVVIPPHRLAGERKLPAHITSKPAILKRKALQELAPTHGHVNQLVTIPTEEPPAKDEAPARISDVGVVVTKIGTGSENLGDAVVGDGGFAGADLSELRGSPIVATV